MSLHPALANVDLLVQAASIGSVQTAVARLEKPGAKGKLRIVLEISATIVVEILLSFI
jgi:hypothetical protein